ncbi:MAG: hypothetical protein QOI01_1701 [Mycobacterium sp.]|nr:hypothetical protein [Mycobacterium sp.]
MSIEHAAGQAEHRLTEPAGSARWLGISWAATGSCSITTSPGTTPTSKLFDTYEGTDSIQSLIVGRAITGLNAFR